MSRRLSKIENWTEPQNEAEAEVVVNDIYRRWQNPDFVLDVATLCDHVNRMSAGPLREHIKRRVPFGPSKFSKYATIGARKILYRSDVKSYLPPRYTTLYAIAQLSDEILDAAITDGTITPAVTLKRIKILLGQQSATSAKPDVRIIFKTDDAAALAVLLDTLKEAETAGLVSIKW